MLFNVVINASKDVLWGKNAAQAYDQLPFKRLLVKMWSHPNIAFL